MNRLVLVSGLERTRERFLRSAAPHLSGWEDSYAPGKWTIRQIMTHLADTEVALFWRFARAAGEGGVPVERFDQDAWAANLAYTERPMEVVFAQFDGIRRTFIHLVATLPDTRLLAQCVHPERGNIAAWQWANGTVNHTDHHLDQVEAIRSGQPWVRKA